MDAIAIAAAIAVSRPIAPTGNHLNFPLTLRRYHAFAEDAANSFDGKIFRKVFKVENRLFLLSLQESKDGVVVSIQPPTRSPSVWQTAERLAHKILGLEFPLDAFYEFARHDPVFHNDFGCAFEKVVVTL